MNKKDYFYSKSFCTAPWTNIYIDPTGNVRTCSVGKAVLGNINDDDIDSILKNSEKLKDLKQRMINGEKPEHCNECYYLEKNNKNIYSPRIHYKKISKDLPLVLFENSSNFFLNSVDLRWKNTCQNACVYCGPDLSNQWEKELYKINKIEVEVNSQNKNLIFSQLAQLKEVYLAGGEPLIIKDNIDLLQRLLEINPNVNVRVNSNIRNINTQTYELVKKFKNKQFTISVDAIEDKFEYIRFPHKWSNFVQNVDIVTSEITMYNFNIVLSILNAHNLIDTIEWLLTKHHQNAFIITHATNPEWTNINNLPNHELKRLKLEYETYLTKLDSTCFLYKALVGVINFIDFEYPKNLQSTFDNLHTLDKRRKLDSKKTFPDLYKFVEN